MGECRGRRGHPCVQRPGTMLCFWCARPMEQQLTERVAVLELKVDTIAAVVREMGEQVDALVRVYGRQRSTPPHPRGDMDVGEDAYVNKGE